MEILLVGGGAREHTWARKLHQDHPTFKYSFFPGNGGTAEIGTNISPDEIENEDQLVKWASRSQVGFCFIGPEAYLVSGLGDKLSRRGIKTFGPTEKAARIEGSKIFSGKFMMKRGIPTPRGVEARTPNGILIATDILGPRVALKGDGLAGGKAVEFATNVDEAMERGSQMLDGKYGDASKRLWIQELVEGPELSVMAFTDGERVAIMPPSRDFKKAYDRDKGPNTGGMGAICYPGIISDDLLLQIKEEILKPAITGLAAEERPFRGVLYAGLILTKEGPKVLEFNCRPGDPEIQVTLPRLESDLLSIMNQVIDGNLDPESIEWNNNTVVGVTLASDGYPDKYRTGFKISNLDKLYPDNLFFHAGTIKTAEGVLITSGGRVGTSVGFHNNPVNALRAAYEGAETIRFENKTFRQDIGEIDLFEFGTVNKY